MGIVKVHVCNKKIGGGGGGEKDLILGIQDLDFDFNTLAKFLGIQDLSIYLKVFQGILGILVYLYDIIIIYAFHYYVIHDPTSCKL